MPLQRVVLDNHYDRALVLQASSTSCAAQESKKGSKLADLPLCRYCWGPENGDDRLVDPCACTGSVKHVHYKCLVRWVSASMAAPNKKSAWPLGHCEICHQKLFEHAKQRHLLLQTAAAELHLAKLYAAAESGVAQRGTEWHASQAAQQPSGSYGWLLAYCRLALRPIQCAMLLHSLNQHAAYLPNPQNAWQHAAGLASACAVHAASWFAGTLCQQWVQAYAELGRWGSVAASCFMLANMAGSDICCWLKGQPSAGGAFFLRLPLSMPYFQQMSAALAVAGAMFPGQFPGADGLRAAAMAPLVLLKWVVGDVLGRRGGAARLLSMLCRLLSDVPRSLGSGLTNSQQCR